MADKLNFKSGVAALASLTMAAAIAGGIAGCGEMTGDVTANVAPVVEFTNVPADRDTFSYAPYVTWKGRDSDGFVESYSYADVIDSTAILDPDYYINFIPPEAWVETESMADTVYLLTETGQVTQHVFYLKCKDDRGRESPVIYRTFYRSNRPPRVPEVKWFLSGDEAYGNDVSVRDTLYSLDEANETWPGLGFNWRSTDPDDRELYRIPLQYRYYLERSPHDTVWQWTSRNWASRQDLTFADLPTGHYTFSVWARDDGYEVSSRPATATFDVYQPSFEQPILLINCSLEDPSGRAGRGNIVPGTQIGDFYQTLLAPHTGSEYFHFNAADSIALYKSFLGRFRLVILVNENFTRVNMPYETALRDYVRVGGKLWVIGGFVRRNLISNTTLALAGCTFAGPGSGVTVPSNEAEFVSAIAGVRGLPSLAIDTAKCGATFREFWGRNYKTYPLLPGVDIMTTGSGAETVYYFQSYTDTANGDVLNDVAEVKANIDTIYYPPTPVDCLIKLNRSRVLEVTRVENITRGVRGQVLSLTNNVGSTRQTVVRVSYPYDEPWATTDSIRVDYRFQPYSDFHRKPVSFRYERLISEPGSTFVIRYRVAVTTFPLYFMDNSNGDVTRMFNNMLDWFFLPYAH